MSWAAIAAAVVGAGVSVGAAAASAPEYANPASSSRKVSLAALKALPGQRQVEAAARLGKNINYDADNWLSPKQALDEGWIDKETYRKLKRQENKMDEDGFFEGGPFGGGVGVNLLSDLIAPGSSMGYLAEAPMRTHDGKIKLNVGKRKADFTGYGDADVQGKLAKQMAQIQLDLQKKYGADFIAEARKQQEQADPEGTAARKLLASEINRVEEERKTRQRPVAGALDAQVLGELDRGTGLDDSSTSAIEKVLRERGGNLGAEDIATELEGGPAGEARKSARVQKAMSYLSSGASPEDAAFREKQTSLANMASFLSGRTPQSQFASLSGGQQGASPTPQGPGLPNVQGGMPGMADNAALQNYSQGIRATANNVSPWFAGLSLLTKGLATGGNAMTPQQRN